MKLCMAVMAVAAGRQSDSRVTEFHLFVFCCRVSVVGLVGLEKEQMTGLIDLAAAITLIGLGYAALVFK